MLHPSNDQRVMGIIVTHICWGHPLPLPSELPMLGLVLGKCPGTCRRGQRVQFVPPFPHWGQFSSLTPCNHAVPELRGRAYHL